MGRQYSAEFITQLSFCKVGYSSRFVTCLTIPNLYPTLQISWSATNFTGFVTSCVNPTEAWYNGFTMQDDTNPTNPVSLTISGDGWLIHPYWRVGMAEIRDSWVKTVLRRTGLEVEKLIRIECTGSVECCCQFSDDDWETVQTFLDMAAAERRGLPQRICVAEIA